jgi:hypothetical protein
MTTDKRARRARSRRHAATGARILVASLSAASALGLMGSMARASRPSIDGPSSTTSDSDAASAYVIIRGDAAVGGLPTAPRVAPTTAVPDTTSRAS